MVVLTWVGIGLCLSQSALLSGLNLGLFSVSKLELEVEARKGDRRTGRVLKLREDANFALVTILWGNVGVNVLLALLSGSVMTGIVAFVFSTVVITVFAEIIPQAYFTRNALRMASLLAPLLRVYQVLLYPVARPTAWMLDRWLGGEVMRLYRERDLRGVIRLHMGASGSEIARVEGQGALNFLELDDLTMDQEGESLDPRSMLTLPFESGRPVFPTITASPNDPFLRDVNRAGTSRVILVDTEGDPRLVLDADALIRDALFDPCGFSPLRHCHRPIIVTDGRARLGELIARFRPRAQGRDDDIIEDDVILLWNDHPRVVTGSDLLGRLLRGIAASPAARPGGMA